jgi:osmotically-inducible protein OsmY
MITTLQKDVDKWMGHAVMRELEWDPECDASDVAAIAKNGMVILTGFIDTYAGKLAAERAATRVRGVRAVANDIGVRLRFDRTDADIAADIAKALTLHSAIPETVQAAVHAGHVALTGEVQWPYQARGAANVVHHINGVRDVRNCITVAARPIERDVRQRIGAALHHNANVDARHITEKIVGDTAQLTGTVGTWLQRESAEQAAANAPGIRKVDNVLVVEPPEFDGDEIC